MPRSASVPFAILNPTPTLTTTQRPSSIADSASLHSPASPGQLSSMAPFMTPDFDGPDSGIIAGDSELQNSGRSPILTSLPPFPVSPIEIDGSKHAQDLSKSFFSNKKASKSSPRMIPHTPTIRQVSQETSRSLPQSRENPIYTCKPAGSTPDLSLSAFDLSAEPPNESDDSVIARRPPGISAVSDSNLSSTSAHSRQANRAKPRFPRLLTRTRSQRVDDGGRRSKPSTPIGTRITEVTIETENTVESEGLRTAPLQQENDRSFRDMLGSNRRNRSADRPSERQNTIDEGQGLLVGEQINKPLPRGLTSFSSATVLRGEGPLREGAGTGSHLFSGLKSTSSKAADGLGKAGKGLMGKFTKGNASHTKEVSTEREYQFRVITLPLREQVRVTRIAKRLEDAKDKTEFWLPAMAWRCIDYLNFKAYKEEGLYRIPGSQLEIKHWQQVFDQELDVNLIRQSNLYDVNVVGSLLKTWLRSLPDEILPKATQERIAAAHPDAITVPQMLKDELSLLPPWDYYLLFAITCHLHLLGEYVEENKMTYKNLLTCFQPSLKIDHYCFKFLVTHWRKCWQGCWTEKDYRDEEYRILAALRLSRDDTSSAETVIGKQPFLTMEQTKALPWDRVDRQRLNVGPMPGRTRANMFDPNDDDTTLQPSNINNQDGDFWTPPDGARMRANNDLESGDGYPTPIQNGSGNADGLNGSELPELTFSPIRFGHEKT